MGKTLEFTKKKGDKVWIMRNNKPKRVKVVGLAYYVSDESGMAVKDYDVSGCFDTKDELLDSLR